MLALAINTTDLAPLDRFPEYTDPFEFVSYPEMTPPSFTSPTHKVVGNLLQVETPDRSRFPSPQPTHFSVPLLGRPGGNGHRVLRSATVGYIAPEFTGKVEQMQQGW